MGSRSSKGEYYNAWVDTMKGYGYNFAWRVLNSADYGAYTSRSRYFGIFARPELPIAFPKPTHAKNPQNGLKKWNAVKDVLNFKIEGESIFTRKKPLADATLERIYAGLIKFVAGGKEAFLSRLSRYNTVNPMHAALSIDEPCGVLTTENRFAKVQPVFLSKYFSGDPDSKNQSVNEPTGAITTIDHHALVHTRFLSAYYGNGHNHGVNKPAPVVTTRDRLALVETVFLNMQYGNGTPADCNQPAPTVTTNPKHNLVQCERYLMNPQYASAGGSVDNPCFTLIARMDKMPPYIISTKTGEVAIEIYETDSEIMRKIKRFMALYGIVDIKMRMLIIEELLRIMGFGDNYKLIGTKAEQKKYIGNAVEVTMSQKLCEATVEALFVWEYELKIAA